jgi:DNA-binding transcriptional LysR family regulator
VEGRVVVASFDGGRIASDAGTLLLGAADQAIGPTRRMAACFTDARNPDLIEHDVEAPAGCTAEPVMPLDLLLFLAPPLFGQGDDHTVLERPPLLRQTTPEAWEVYFRLAGLDVLQMRRGPVHDLLSMGLAAAETCQGAALVPDFLTGEALSAGRVRRVRATTLRAPASYRLCVPPGGGPPCSLLLFTAWLRPETR